MQKMDSRLYAAHQLFKQIGYPFESLKLSVKNGQPFERLQLSMQKKIVICLSGSGYLFKKHCQLFEWLELSVQKKKMFSVGTAQAIR